jgi:hypothetical protein
MNGGEMYTGYWWESQKEGDQQGAKMYLKKNSMA